MTGWQLHWLDTEGDLAAPAPRTCGVHCVTNRDVPDHGAAVLKPWYTGTPGQVIPAQIPP